MSACPASASATLGSVAHPEDLRLRRAGPSDAEAIAALHADSWHRHYRGAYADAYLDGDVVSDRLAVWAKRLREPDPLHHTILVEDGDGLVGFAHTILDEDAAWGALLDNLHVVHGHRHRGIGTRLLASCAPVVLERRTGLYLWVLEQNVAAQTFYAARGGTCAGRALVPPPGGVAGRLNGSPAMLRYAWDVEQLARLHAEHLEN